MTVLLQMSACALAVGFVGAAHGTYDECSTNASSCSISAAARASGLARASVPPPASARRGRRRRPSANAKEVTSMAEPHRHGRPTAGGGRPSRRRVAHRCDRTIELRSPAHGPAAIPDIQISTCCRGICGGRARANLLQPEPRGDALDRIPPPFVPGVEIASEDHRTRTYEEPRLPGRRTVQHTSRASVRS